MAFFLSPAHIGIDKTLERFKNRLFWPGIKEYGKDYCKSCSFLSQKTIHKTKQNNTKKLHFLDIWSEYRLTFLDPYKSQTLIINMKHNRIWLFHKVDRSHPNTRPDPAATFAKAFVNNYISHSGCPLQIREINFKSKVFQNTCLCEPFQIDLTKKIALRPQSNENIEWFQRTLASMLTIYLLRRPK